MANQATPVEVYLEVGQKKVFAGALAWPGWCRSGRDEEAALAALIASGPRYGALFARTKVDFAAPNDRTRLNVAEWVVGNRTTDFGAPDVAPARDTDPFDAAERERSEEILAAIWRGFDQAVEAAEGKELRKGPRGGGRERDAIIRHVLGADAAYLRSLGQKFKAREEAPLGDELQRTRAAIRAALVAAERGEIPEQGPRGGKIWTPRYFVRRVAWHTVDHLWEIEDRIV